MVIESVSFISTPEKYIKGVVSMREWSRNEMNLCVHSLSSVGKDFQRIIILAGMHISLYLLFLDLKMVYKNTPFLPI